jgi:aryl-alcohol dehydrogenase-like predicted oxidoreductase
VLVSLWDKVILGRTGLSVSRIGLGSSYGLGAADVERAVERGLNYLYWGSIRRPSFAEAVRNLGPARRDELVIVVQSYTRAGFWMRRSLESALRRMRIDHADLLLLGWWNAPPPRRILDAALELRAAGKAKHVMISCHNRLTFERFIADEAYGAIMVRYNAAHPGAEREVFPFLEGKPASARPGVVAYTATRWGELLDPRHTPDGDRTPRASDCYRFALTHPAVDLVLSGPKDGAQLDEAMSALDAGPLDADELAWMKRIGVRVRAAGTSRTRNLPMQLIDRLAGGAGST